MESPDQSSAAADLLDRLLVDPEFRRLFRRDPAGSARQLGLPELAEQLAARPKGMNTLDLRESRSSLAGVLMAAAAETVGIIELTHHLHGGKGLSRDAAEAVNRVVNRRPQGRKVASGLPGPVVHATVGLPKMESRPIAPIRVSDLVAMKSAQGGSGFDALHQAVASGPDRHLHPAYDLYARAGAPVQSPVAGTVVEVRGSQGVLGGTVAVRGADGRVWVLSDVNPTKHVSVGDEVAAGQKIATVTPLAPHPGGGPGQVVSAREVIGVAREQIGDPYRWGQDGPTGFDCSGLVYYSLTHAGVKIPRFTADGFFSHAARVSRNRLVPGDLIFFNYGRLARGHADHVGIYIGGGKMIAASSSAHHVEAQNIDWKHFIGGGRLSEVKEGPKASHVEGGSHIHIELWKSFKGGRTNKNMEDPLVELRQAYGGNVPGEKASGLPGVASVGAGGKRQTLGMIPAISSNKPARNYTVQVLPAVKDGGPRPGSSALGGAASNLPIPGGPDAYPGDGASQAAIAAWMARQAEKAGLPPELPIMAALTESGLRNLNHGDLDSVGFFQMRLSVWNHGKYAGYAHDPELQLRWFIAQALAIKNQRGSGFGKDPNSWGQWVADIENPAKQYRGRYQLNLDAARQLLA